jgi:hypothetical protein
MVSLIMLLIITAYACHAAVLPPSFKGRVIQLDSGFDYYLHRSPESIAKELAAHGYRAVSLHQADAKLVQACKSQGISVRYIVGCNGDYPPGHLPKGWEKWKMVLRNPTANSGAYIYLCENEPEFRAWKKQQITQVLQQAKFQAVDLAEPYLPSYDGPKSEYYGCLCDRCKAAFLKRYPEEKNIPEFNDSNSPDYWTTNKALYRKWMDFRVDTVASFLDDLVNGPDGIRRKCPGVAVCTWSIAAILPNSVETMREWEASDGAAICAKVHPDAHCIQTDRPDWINPTLPSSYPLKYQPFVDAIQKVDPKLPLVIQTDIGSNINASKRAVDSRLREYRKKDGFLPGDCV